MPAPHSAPHKVPADTPTAQTLALAARHPVASYLLLTLAWSWSVWSLLLPLVGQGGLLNQAPPLAYGVALVGACGPSLSGLLLTRLLYGRQGIQSLRARLRWPRVGWGWCMLLIIPATTAGVPLMRAASGHAQDLHAMLGLVVPGLGLGLATGLMEEFGWRGFLLPHLLQQHSPLVASLWTGLIWGGLWHGYADYFGIPGAGASWWLLMALLGPGLLSAWSLVLTCAHERTAGNLWISVLMHASLSSSALICAQRYATRPEELAWTATSVGLAFCAAGLLWWRVH